MLSLVPKGLKVVRIKPLRPLGHRYGHGRQVDTHGQRADLESHLNSSSSYSNPFSGTRNVMSASSSSSDLLEADASVSPQAPDNRHLKKPHTCESSSPGVVEVLPTVTSVHYSRIKAHVGILEVNEGFQNEFLWVCEQESLLETNQASAKHPQNKDRNRYSNILPLEGTRVKLDSVVNDYINANYINGYKKEKLFIAAQGPLTQTAGDFWKMVWEQRSISVVMTTKLVENGRLKCDQYWPNIDCSARYGDFLVETVDEQDSECGAFLERQIQITHSRLEGHDSEERSSDEDGNPKSAVANRGDDNVRTIVQYYYKSWPDHGVPSSPTGVLEMLAAINERQEVAEFEGDNPGPVVIHCSAGVGRTGTMIAIDTAIKSVLDKDNGYLDFPQIVLSLRNQRQMMVQSLSQYAFCYYALEEFISTDLDYNNDEHDETEGSSDDQGDDQ
eukprot:CFRG0353T1